VAAAELKKRQVAGSDGNFTPSSSKQPLSSLSSEFSPLSSAFPRSGCDDPQGALEGKALESLLAAEAEAVLRLGAIGASAEITSTFVEVAIYLC